MLVCAGPHPWERQAGDGNASIGHHQEKAMNDSAIPSAFSILISGLSFLESPRWRAGRLWLSDFFTHQVIAFDIAGPGGEDCDGNAYVGNFGFDLMGGGSVRSAQLARVAPDGQVVAVAYDLRFPNG